MRVLFVFSGLTETDSGIIKTSVAIRLRRGQLTSQPPCQSAVESAVRRFYKP